MDLLFVFLVVLLVVLVIIELIRRFKSLPKSTAIEKNESILLDKFTLTASDLSAVDRKWFKLKNQEEKSVSISETASSGPVIENNAIVFNATPNDSSLATGEWNYYTLKPFRVDNKFTFNVEFTFTGTIWNQRVFEFHFNSGGFIALTQDGTNHNLALRIRPGSDKELISAFTPWMEELPNLKNVPFVVQGSYDFYNGTAFLSGYYIKSDKTYRTFYGSYAGFRDSERFDFLTTHNFTENYVANSDDGSYRWTQMKLTSLNVPAKTGVPGLQRFYLDGSPNSKATTILANPTPISIGQKVAGSTKINYTNFTYPAAKRWISFYGDELVFTTDPQSACYFYKLQPFLVDFHNEFIITAKICMHTDGGWYQRILEFRNSTDSNRMIFLGQYRDENSLCFYVKTQKGEFQAVVQNIPDVVSFNQNKNGLFGRDSTANMSVFAGIRAKENKLWLAVNGKIQSTTLPVGFIDQILFFDLNHLCYSSLIGIPGAPSFTDASIMQLEIINDIPS